MINITTGGKNYVVGSFENLYRMEARDIGNVQVPVRKNSLEAKRVYKALAERR